MTDMTASKEKTNDLTQLEEKHQQLLEELADKSPTFRHNPMEKDRFIQSVNRFLDDVGRYTGMSEAGASADFVRRLASEWQLAFTTQLQVAQNVSAILNVSRLTGRTEHGYRVPESERMSREAVESWIRERANKISRLWKLRWASQLLYQLEQNPSSAHSVAISPPVRSEVDDWNEACAFFAHEVFEARIDFALQLGVQCYEFLSEVWLEDVKRLKAYFVWELASPPHEDSWENYYFSCQEIHKRLVDPEIKADVRSFAHISDWLNREFLVGGRLCPAKPLCHATIAKKAYRLWQVTGCEDANENWRRAEDYVRDFYENLTPAIRDRNQLAVVSALSAAAPCPETGESCELVNSLEAVLVTYFMDPQLMTEFFEGHSTYL